MMTEPGFKRPLSYAPSITALAMRSFTLPAGLKYSSLPGSLASRPSFFQCGSAPKAAFYRSAGRRNVMRALRKGDLSSDLMGKQTNLPLSDTERGRFVCSMQARLDAVSRSVPGSKTAAPDGPFPGARPHIRRPRLCGAGVPGTR